MPFKLLGDEAKGWLDTTYLSRNGNLRISRGNKVIHSKKKKTTAVFIVSHISLEIFYGTFIQSGQKLIQ